VNKSINENSEKESVQIESHENYQEKNLDIICKNQKKNYKNKNKKRQFDYDRKLKNKIQMKERRESKDYKEHQNEKMRLYYERIREDPIKGLERNCYLKNYRNRKGKKEIIRNQVKDCMVKIRSDPIKYKNELNKNQNYRLLHKNELAEIIKSYEEKIQEGPTKVCVCCGGLFFSRSIEKIKQSYIVSLKKPFVEKCIWARRCLESFEDCTSYFMCVTCSKKFKNGEVPDIALSNGLEYPVIDERILRLNDLEERLVSPRIPFLVIRELGWDKQKGIIIIK